MTVDIQLIEDGDGIAVIGEPAAVERFLRSEGLPSRSLDLPRLGAVLGAAGIAADAAAALASQSGRWVKLTKKSAEGIKRHGQMVSTKSGLGMGVIKGADGRIKGIVEFASTGPVAALANPAALASLAGMMAQASMQQSIDEINDYLATIDEKVDDLLRGQKDAVLADMIGVDLVIDDAMAIREQTGRVSEVTWSKVQMTAMALARTQGYALRQLGDIAEKLERTVNLGDTAKVTREAEPKVREWLAVLARCVQLQDSSAILELDRILDTGNDDLDQHRIALATTRKNRIDLLERSTGRLLARMDAAVGKANAKVLLNPIGARAVVDSSSQLASGVVDFQEHLGLGRLHESLKARRWLAAASEVRDKVLDSGAEGISAARRLSAQTASRTRSASDKLSLRLAEGALRRRDEGTQKQPGLTEEEKPS